MFHHQVCLELQNWRSCEANLAAELLCRMFAERTLPYVWLYNVSLTKRMEAYCLLRLLVQHHPKGLKQHLFTISRLFPAK